MKNQGLSECCDTRGIFLDFFFRHLDKHTFVNKCGLANA